MSAFIDERRGDFGVELICRHPRDFGVGVLPAQDRRAFRARRRGRAARRRDQAYARPNYEAVRVAADVEGTTPRGRGRRARPCRAPDGRQWDRVAPSAAESRGERRSRAATRSRRLTSSTATSPRPPRTLTCPSPISAVHPLRDGVVLLQLRCSTSSRGAWSAGSPAGHMRHRARRRAPSTWPSRIPR